MTDPSVTPAVVLSNCQPPLGWRFVGGPLLGAGRVFRRLRCSPHGIS